MNPTRASLGQRWIVPLLVLLCLAFSFPFAKTLALILTGSVWLLSWKQRKQTTPADATGPDAEALLNLVILISLADHRFALAYPQIALAPALFVVPILLQEWVVSLQNKNPESPKGGTLWNPWGALTLKASIGCALFSLVLVEEILSGADEHLLTSIEYTLHWFIWFGMGVAALLAILSLMKPGAPVQTIANPE